MSRVTTRRYDSSTRFTYDRWGSRETLVLTECDGSVHLGVQVGSQDAGVYVEHGEVLDHVIDALLKIQASSKRGAEVLDLLRRHPDDGAQVATACERHHGHREAAA